MEEISSCCMDRLRGYVKRELRRRRMTHYAPRLVDDDKFPFDVMMDDFHWFSSDGWFMSVYNIPKPEVQHHKKCRGEESSELYSVSVSDNGIGFGNLSVDSGHPRLESVSLDGERRCYLLGTSDKNLRDLHSSLSIGPEILLTRPPTSLDPTTGLWPW